MPSSNLPPPVVLATVICDNVHRDPSSGKHYLLGTFNAIRSTKFPVTHPLMVLYLSVTEINRKGRLRVRIIDVNESRDPIFIKNIELGTDDPRKVIETTVAITNVTFSEPNDYLLQIFFDDELISDRRIGVTSQPGTK